MSAGRTWAMAGVVAGLIVAGALVARRHNTADGDDRSPGSSEEGGGASAGGGSGSRSGAGSRSAGRGAGGVNSAGGIGGSGGVLAGGRGASGGQGGAYGSVGSASEAPGTLGSLAGNGGRGNGSGGQGAPGLGTAGEGMRPPQPYRPANLLRYSEMPPAASSAGDEQSAILKRILDITQVGGAERAQIIDMWHKHEDSRRDLIAAAPPRASGPPIVDARKMAEVDFAFESKLLTKVLQPAERDRLLPEIYPRNPNKK